MAERIAGTPAHPDRRPTAVRAVAAATVALLVLLVPGVAVASVHDHAEPAHDVVLFNPDTWRPHTVPHVRADDITRLHLRYRPHRLIARVDLRGRDYRSDEDYAFLIGHGEQTLIVAVGTSPLDPRGSAMTQQQDFRLARLAGQRAVHRVAARVARSNVHTCPDVTWHVDGRSAEITVPAHCFGRPGKVSVLADVSRSKEFDFFDDQSGDPIWVNRG